MLRRQELESRESLANENPWRLPSATDSTSATRAVQASSSSLPRSPAVAWREGPAVTLQFSPPLSEAQRSEICDLTPVFPQFGNEPSDIRNLRELVDRITANTTFAWPGPEVQPGTVAVSIDVEIADHPILALASGSVTVMNARVTGAVEWVMSIPTSSACYLTTPEGEPVAGAVLVQLRSGLAGLTVGSSTQELRLFHVPNALRRSRPVQRRIFGD